MSEPSPAGTQQVAGWTVERLERTSSTMDLARERARAGADRLAIVAESMDAGRGTQGRAWHAPRGGLYASLVLRGVADVRLASLALGCAVADALEVAGAQPQLKWVNDVWVDGRKIAGILVEAESTGDRVDFLVAGLGINVNGHASDFPAPLRATATTLEDVLGCDTCVPDLEALLLHEVDKWMGLLRDGQGSQVLDAFRSRDALKGKPIAVLDGPRRTEGTADGIDAQGHLIVRTPKGPVAVASGTVELR